VKLILHGKAEIEIFFAFYVRSRSAVVKRLFSAGGGEKRNFLREKSEIVKN
jgi:hypothetical protein